MAKAIEETRAGFIAGHALLGRHGDGIGSVKQVVHDGDTITVQADGNISVRFLGVDAAEISFTLPDNPNAFISLDNPRWAEFLGNPFDRRWTPPGKTPLEEQLPRELLRFLRRRLGAESAANHHRHAMAAQRALEALIEDDMSAAGETKETYRFFLAFAHDVMDRYGRLLGYINRDERDAARRKASYNERLLQQGMVLPYFIWPNVDPFRRQPTLLNAVPAPGQMQKLLQEAPKLRQARESVQTARQTHSGIFSEADPLRLESFELRYLARQAPPDRWLIDLSKDDGLLLRPEKYYAVPNAEDRLWIPAEFVPLFVEKGWKRRR
jgi:endonuclease YncB( thermonuclease family)